MKVTGTGLTVACGFICGLAGAAQAEVPPVETGTLEGAKVSIHTWDFLTPDELAALRLVLVNKDALALFVPADGTGGFAALAVSPDDGFIRDGALAKSASAIAGLETAEAAATAALEACDAARKGKENCAVVLEVAPE
jgi:hypothetical protein